MVSWLISIGHFILPPGSALGLRIIFVILSFFTSIFWWGILKKQSFSEKQIIWFFIFLFLNPLLGFGSVAATPDAPLVFFWSLSFFLFLRVLENKKILDYLWLGLALGLGFCSKYHIVLFLLSGLIYIFTTKKYLQLRWSGVFTTFFSGALACLPVLIWNMQNDWQSFKFQLDHGFGEETFSWSWPIGYLLAQTLITNPLFLISLFQKAKHFSHKIFSLSQLGFFFTSSFKSVVEGNWPLTSHLHSISHGVSHLTEKKLRFAFLFWIGFYLLIAAFLFSDASYKVRKNLVNSSQLDEIYKLVEEYKPLYGPSYQVASLVSWKTQSLVPKLHLLSRHDFYDSLPESKPNAKEFYVLKYDYSEWPEAYNAYKKIKLRSFDNVGLELYQFSYE